jgi:hypothetical protein
MHINSSGVRIAETFSISIVLYVLHGFESPPPQSSFLKIASGRVFTNYEFGNAGRRHSV